MHANIRAHMAAASVIDTDESCELVKLVVHRIFAAR
jgi:hypothetical protein